MNEKEKYRLYDKLANHYGTKPQCSICIEEMSELTKELVKNMRGFENCDKIAEEVADVEIMLEQVVRIYDIEADVEKWKNKKLERTKERLDLLVAN